MAYNQFCKVLKNKIFSKLEFKKRTDFGIHPAQEQGP
jgi:hypothetical protein